MLIAAIVIMGVRGFNWGLDFTGGTVIEITLEKPAEMDVMREALQKAGYEEPQLQNFGVLNSWGQAWAPIWRKPALWRCWWR